MKYKTKIQQGRIKYEYFPNFQRIYCSSSSENPYTVKFLLTKYHKMYQVYTETSNTVQRGYKIMLKHIKLYYSKYAIEILLYNGEVRPSIYHKD